MKPTAFDRSGRRKYLNRSECDAFARAARQESAALAAFCLTLYFTGCRLSEALALTPADIDFAAEVVTIRTLKKRRDDACRRIPIPAKLCRRLKALAEPAQDGRIWDYSRTTAWRQVKRVMEKAGIKGVQASPKGLRHAFGVRAALSRVPVNVIRDWMGHSHIETTAIYLEVMDEESRELIRRTW